MRSTIAIFLGFIILISGSIYVTQSIKDSSENMILQLTQAEFSITNNRWEEADTIINDTYQTWSETKDWWAIVLNHSTLNNIEINFQRLQQFEINHELSLTLAELKTLIILIKDVPASNDLRLNNVF